MAWRPQFSLRALLFVTVVVGLLAGTLGPAIWEMLTYWDPARQPAVPARASGSPADTAGDDGYFESAETPLR